MGSQQGITSMPHRITDTKIAPLLAFSQEKNSQVAQNMEPIANGRTNAAVVSARTFERREFQQTAIADLRSVLRDHASAILYAPTGCHVAGQGVLRFDGSIVPVEQVRCGDLLMGPDSQPRTVLELHRGAGNLQKIVPIKGKPFTVNSGHVLTLVTTNDGSGRT